MQTLPAAPAAAATPQTTATLPLSVSRFLKLRADDPEYPPPVVSGEDYHLARIEASSREAALKRVGSSDQIGRQLARMKLIYGAPELNERLQAERYKLWFTALLAGDNPVPATILDAAFDEHVRLSVFHPKPAEIRQHAERLQREAVADIARLRMVKRDAPTIREEPEREPTAEERARVADLVQRWRRGQTAFTPYEAEAERESVPAAQGGASAHLLQAIAKRRGQAFTLEELEAGALRGDTRPSS